MNFTTHFFVEQKLKKYVADLQSATRRVSQARTLREVRDFSEVHPDSIIRSISRSLSEIRMLEQACHAKNGIIVKQQLTELQDVLQKEGSAAYRALKATFRQRDWCFLNGRFSETLIQLNAALRDIDNLEARNAVSIASAKTAP